MRAYALLLPFLLAASGARAAEKTFPYAVAKRTLPNGLDVVVIETPEFKEVLSFNTLVTGNRKWLRQWMWRIWPFSSGGAIGVVPNEGPLPGRNDGGI